MFKNFCTYYTIKFIVFKWQSFSIPKKIYIILRIIMSRLFEIHTNVLVKSQNIFVWLFSTAKIKNFSSYKVLIILYSLIYSFSDDKIMAENTKYIWDKCRFL